MLSTYSSAVILFDEKFDFLDVGELNGQGVSSSSTQQWAAVTSITEVVTLSTPMTVTNISGETYVSSGKALQITGNSNSAIVADIDSVITSDFYISMFFRMSAGSVGINDFATLWFGEGSHIGSPAIGLKAELGLNNTDFMGRITGNEEAYADNQLVVGESYLIVAKVKKTSGSSTYNELDFWVNPSSSDEGTPQAVSEGSIAFEEFSSLGIRSVNLGADDVIEIDSILVGTEWNDIVPDIAGVVPEPSVSLLMILGSLVVMRRKRHNN
ncbi:MAG: PEP-CTERM sorting domain-containing protein [Akkermansiaceae bacterium]